MRKKDLAIVISVFAFIMVISLGLWFFLSEIFQEWTLSFGVLPKTEFMSNPLEKVPEINPIDKINPFKDMYKNPFM